MIGKESTAGMSAAVVELFWLPLGAGPRRQLVRLSGRVYERLMACRESRPRQLLYHSALRVRLGNDDHVVEMAPVWSSRAAERGAVAWGPVGLPWLGRSRYFRYEVRCWLHGIIDDWAYAVQSPVNIPTDLPRARRLLELVPDFPTLTWGMDELGAGDMWNSNSLISWVLTVSGHDLSTIEPPHGGRAPGWSAGLTCAALTRSSRDTAIASASRSRSPAVS
ncbi:MAG: hypothetical protein JWQ67_2774 [Marmoricola sp.]|nr:hypothetical protein [Marmoricola sp.]